MKTKLTQKQKDDFADIIASYSIISVKMNGKEIWDCTGKETKDSIKLGITAEHKRIYVRGIVSEILDYVSKNCT